ncbi:MAG: CAP domain-containing protein [Bacteroidales bacterium]|nr:MAG: CAP domain-containing protein [Bacteroidales bacterium]
MKNRIIFWFVILSVALIILSCEKKDEGAVVIREDLEQDIVDLINEYRDSTGLNELTVNEVIRREARNHSINMATGKAPFGHEGFEERANTIFSEVGGTVCGENAAEGNYPDATYFIDSWLNSPSHKENIDGDYNYTGVGVAETEDGIKFATQMFLKME